MLRIRTKPFTRLVAGLRELKKTCTVVESCCGGLISTSLMAEPGSSKIYYGGSVAYNTRKAKKLLLNDSSLHGKLIGPIDDDDCETEGDVYVKSKLRWTALSAVSFCEQMNVDFAIAEGGAAGPTFPYGLEKGFAVIAIAGRDPCGDVKILSQKVVHSTHADREQNMRFFADAAAQLAMDTIGIVDTKEDAKDCDDIRIDRATELRSNIDVIKKLEKRPDAKHVIVNPSTNECLFTSQTNLALVTSDHIPGESNKTFLGFDKNKIPIFSIDVESSYVPPNGTYFLPTRTSAPLLNKFDNELALYATAMSTWKHTHKFCSQCGSRQISVHGGTCLKCTNTKCNTFSWPRQDPSIIVLITNQDESMALLARSPRHPPKLHTAIAGFVEAGETFENAVIREAFEETGIEVHTASIKYLASQPWPFPRSTMIAFRARADDSLPLTLDTNELVSASWFKKEDVIKAATLQGAMMEEKVAKAALENDPSLQLLIPPKGVVARLLIDDWLEDK